MGDPSLPDTILYFGNDWDAENRTSSHHVARWLARRFRVLYFESPGLRTPHASGRDFRKVLTKLRRFVQGPRRVEERLWVQTLLHVPLHRFVVVRALNRALTRLTVAMLKRRYHVDKPIAWFVVPHLAAVAGSLGQALSVYYCTDDYPTMPGVDTAAVRRMDDDLTRKADLVFAASATLLERKRALNSAAHLSPHGVDFEHFHSAQDPALRVPEDVARVQGPVVGFFGLVERWIDVDLLAWLAEQRPAWRFVMIGRVALPESEVPRKANLLFLGQRPYADLPAYGKRFDVAIIPYRLTPQVLHANPIKLREYLALGKPIVSVSTPEIDAFADWVRIARTREEFLAALDRAVAQGLSDEERTRQLELASTLTWDAQLEKVMRIVQDRLAEIGRPREALLEERSP